MTDPAAGAWSYVEFNTHSEPTAQWGTDVVDASPDEPDAILQDADGWTFVGKVLGYEPGTYYGDGGTLLSEGTTDRGPASEASLEGEGLALLKRSNTRGRRPPAKTKGQNVIAQP